MQPEKRDCKIQMQKEMIIKKLRENGCRMTAQREMLLDIILKGECSSIKEIYYKASSRNIKIGTATVYRMIVLLEKIGIINRENMYKMVNTLSGEEKALDILRVELDDSTQIRLSSEEGRRAIQLWLESEGYIDGQQVTKIVNIREEENDAG